MYARSLTDPCKLNGLRGCLNLALRVHAVSTRNEVPLAPVTGMCRTCGAQNAIVTVPSLARLGYLVSRLGRSVRTTLRTCALRLRRSSLSHIIRNLREVVDDSRPFLFLILEFV
jgi:hypothetical protein